MSLLSPCQDHHHHLVLLWFSLTKWTASCRTNSHTNCKVTPHTSIWAVNKASKLNQITVPPLPRLTSPPVVGRAKLGRETDWSNSSSQGDIHEDFCTVCRRSGQLLMCDTCSRVYHLDCLDPPLKTIPKGMWICPKCQDQVIAAAETDPESGGVGYRSPGEGLCGPVAVFKCTEMLLQHCPQI